MQRIILANGLMHTVEVEKTKMETAVFVALSSVFQPISKQLCYAINWFHVCLEYLYQWEPERGSVIV